MKKILLLLLALNVTFAFAQDAHPSNKDEHLIPGSTKKDDHLTTKKDDHFTTKKDERSVGLQRMVKSREIHWKKLQTNAPLIKRYNSTLFSKIKMNTILCQYFCCDM